MFTKALLPLSVLLALTVAKPILSTRQSDTYYIKPTIKLDSRPQFDGKVLHASNGGLYLGVPTTTDCPGAIYPCETFSNKTAITIFQTGGGVGMDVYVPGGQIGYINGTGEFGFTAAHAQNVPSDAYQFGFARTEVLSPPSGRSYAKLIFKGQDWVICPVGSTEVGDSDGIWQLHAAYIGYKHQCVNVEVEAVDVGSEEPQAYEYVAPYTIS